jgi:hypothetical protein
MSQKNINYDFTSLYPTTMKDWTKDRELLKIIRKIKLQKINKFQNEQDRV